MVGDRHGEWEIIEELGNGKIRCRCSCGTIKTCNKYQVTHGLSSSCGCKALENKRRIKNNLEGKTINEWTIIKELGKGKVIARCSCGLERECSKATIVDGRSKSCGHNTNARTNLVNKQINEFTILEELGYGWVRCKCSCGTEKILRKALVTGEYVKSCGCKRIEKMKETVRIRYNETTTNRKNNPREAWQIEAIQSKQKFIQLINSKYNYKPTIKELVELLNINEASIGRVIRQLEVQSYINFNPNVSVPEKEVREFIKSIYYGEMSNNRRDIIKGFELDIYIPNLKLAIEFNGDYWHSTYCIDSNYHQTKTIECAKNGIRLIHIFEYEWQVLEIRDKIKDYIKNTICEHTNVYARECNVVEITTDEATVFCEQNHLQGYVNSSIKIGLKQNNKLISVMTFGVPRFTTDDCDYELIRLCTKQGVTVVGGAQKMFKYFIETYKPHKIVTYCDISKFTGNIYPKLGFKCDKITKPNYKWVSTDREYTVLSRYQTQKHKLIEKGLGTSDQTENDIMENLGFLKIYDSGNLRLLWERS